MKSISKTLLIGLSMSLFTYFFIPTPQKAISGECDYFMIKSAAKEALDEKIYKSTIWSSDFLSSSDVESAVKDALSDFSFLTSGGVKRTIRSCLDGAYVDSSGDISTYC